VAGSGAAHAALHLLLDDPDMRADRDGVLQGTLQTKVGLRSRAIQAQRGAIKGTGSLLLGLEPVSATQAGAADVRCWQVMLEQAA